MSSHRSSAANLLTLARVEREQPWNRVLDGGLVLAGLVWLLLAPAMSAHPVPFALFSALLVGSIVHRAFLLMEGPQPTQPRDET
jgi:hypothetical protein